MRAQDPAQTVTIRGVTCNGGGNGIRGVYIVSATSVFLEGMVIANHTSQGVLDARTNGGALFIKDTVIRNNTGAGIAAATTGGPYGATINNVHSLRNGFGVAVGNGNNVRISGSVFSNNTNTGLETDGGGQIAVDSSVISFNLVNGLLNNGTMSISNSDITFNQTGITGSVTSFGNNRIFGNSAAGAAPVVGAASTDHGQQ